MSKLYPVTLSISLNERPINPRPDSLVPSALFVNDYCQNATSAWKKLGAKTTQVNARMHGNCGP